MIDDDLSSDLVVMMISLEGQTGAATGRTHSFCSLFVIVPLYFYLGCFRHGQHLGSDLACYFRQS